MSIQPTVDEVRRRARCFGLALDDITARAVSDVARLRPGLALRLTGRDLVTGLATEHTVPFDEFFAEDVPWELGA